MPTRFGGSIAFRWFIVQGLLGAITALAPAAAAAQRPDLLTRIGRDQIAQCSSLTYDFAVNEIQLGCGPAPD